MLSRYWWPYQAFKTMSKRQWEGAGLKEAEVRLLISSTLVGHLLTEVRDAPTLATGLPGPRARL